METEKNLFNSHEGNDERKASPERGHNVAISIDIIRHGEKDAEGGLSDKPEAVHFGEKVAREGWHAVKIYSSPIPRNVDTAEAMIEGINKVLSEEGGATRVLKPRIKIPLAFGSFANENEINKDIAEQNISTDQAIFNFVLDDPRAQEDLEEWSASIANMIRIFRDMAGRLRDNTRLKIINSTHDQAIGHLLPRIVADSDANKLKSMLRENSIQPLEGFEITVFKDKDGVEKFDTVNFRGTKYHIDQSKFDSLVDLWREDPITDFDIERISYPDEKPDDYKLIARRSGVARVGKGFKKSIYDAKE